MAYPTNRRYWGMPSESFNFQIKAPIWARWWAYLIYVFTIVSIVIIVYRLELSRKLALAESKRLKSLEALRKGIFTNITHEFRTPLSVILGMANTLSEKGIQNSRRTLEQSVGLIQKNGNDLLELVNQMLDLSKLESGHHQLNLEQGNIIAYLSSLTQNYAYLASQKDIQLEFQTKLVDLMMDFDQKAIQQIFSNLLINAIKFTPEGGEINIHIDTLEKPPQRYLRLQIKDNGFGIPKEEVPKIFDKFYQVSSSKHVHQGTGIGLALTKELSTQMNGHIRVRTKEGMGSTFIIDLPISQNKPINTSLNLKGSKPSKSKSAPLPEAGKNILELPVLLIIEDKQDIIQYLRISLAYLL